MSSKLLQKQLSSLAASSGHTDTGKPALLEETAKQSKALTRALKKKQAKAAKVAAVKKAIPADSLVKRNTKYFAESKGPSSATRELMSKLLPALKSAGGSLKAKKQ